MRLALLPLLALLAASTPAAATGGFTCRADDAALRFAAGSPITRGMGGQFLDVRGVLEIRLPNVPTDFARLDLDASALTHSWLRERELRLLFYRERNVPFGYVVFVVETRSEGEDEEAYQGEYVLHVYDDPGSAGGEARTVEMRGPVSCSVE